MKKYSFTVLELVIVMSVLSILAAILLTGVGRINTSTRRASTITLIKNIYAGLEAYKNKYGLYPTPQEDSRITYASVWKKNTAFAINSYVSPSNGYSYKSSGGTSGNTEPSWSTNIGNTVSDGSITWTCVTERVLSPKFRECISINQDNLLNNTLIDSFRHPMVYMWWADQWQKNRAYSVGEIVVPTDTYMSTHILAKFRYYQVINSGTSVDTEPDWDADAPIPGNTISLNGVTYVCLARPTHYPFGWKPDHYYNKDTFCGTPNIPNEFAYKSMNDGKSDNTEPSWPVSIGSSVGDNEITWRCHASVPLSLIEMTHTMFIYSYGEDGPSKSITSMANPWPRYPTKAGSDIGWATSDCVTYETDEPNNGDNLYYREGD